MNNNHYEQCISSLENQIRSREQERVKLIEAIEGLERELNQINNRYQNVCRDCEQMAADIHFLEDKLRTQETAMNDNKRVISNFTILNRQAQENSTMFKSENDRLTKSQAAMTAQLKKVNEQKKKLQKDFSDSVAKYYQEISNAQNEIGRLSDLNQELTEQLKQKQMNLSDTVSTLSNERLTSQNEISRLSKLTQELGEQLKQKEVANQSVKQEKEKLERNLGDFKMMNNKKDESSQIMLKRIDDGQKLIAKLGGQKLILSQAIKDANQKCNAYDTSVKTLKIELSQANSHILQLQKDKNGIALKLTESKKQNEQLIKEKDKFQMMLESTRKKNQELSTSGNSLGSELDQYREVSKNLQEENDELKVMIDERELQLSELQKRSVKEKETNKSLSDSLQQKIKTLQTVISEHESEYQLLSKTSKKTIEDLQKKLKTTTKEIEQKSTHFSGQSSKLQTLYRNLQSQSSETIAFFEQKCQQQEQTIERLESTLLHTQQSFESNDIFQKEKEQMLDKYAQSEKTLREIVESIKQSLIQKEEEIHALEEANSTLRQHNFKLLQTENEIRRECNDLKSRISQSNRFKNKRRTYVDVLPQRQTGSNLNLRESAASEISKKKSSFLDRKRTSQVSND